MAVKYYTLIAVFYSATAQTQLGFNRMPRLRNIGSQKLYRPDTGITDSFQRE